MAGIPNHLREIQIIGERTREILINPGQCPPFHDLGVILAGISWASAEFRFERPRPRMQQALVSLAGSGRVWTNGKWQTCSPGQTYLTPAGTYHGYRAGRRWEVAWVILEPEASWGFPSQPALRNFSGETLRQIVTGLHLEIGAGGRELPLAHWTELLRQSVQDLAAEPVFRLGRLWRAVQERPGEDWTLEQMARTAGLGAENLRLICQKEFGRSPAAHLAVLRMQYATSLLRVGHKVDFVARRVGYRNPFAFSTAFRRITGNRPSEVRQSVTSSGHGAQK